MKPSDSYNAAFDVSDCIGEMNNQYDKYRRESTARAKIIVEIPCNKVNSPNHKVGHGHTKAGDGTMLKIPNKGTDQLNSINSCNVVSFDLGDSIQTMNFQYEKFLKDSKVQRQPTFRKLSPSNLTDFYDKWKKRNSTKKQREERKKAIFNYKADKTIRYSRLCISIAITFFVLTMPANLPDISYLFDLEPFPWFNGTYVAITNFLESLNYSCNFFVYCIANSIIRQAARNDLNRCIQFLFATLQKFRSMLDI